MAAASTLVQAPMTRQCWRWLRVVWRLLLGVLIVACLFPWLKLSQKRRLRQWWSAALLNDLGVSRHFTTKSLPTQRNSQSVTCSCGKLFVSNHISWLDIFVINAYTPVAFIAKSDVRDWPVLGWLAARNETVFLQRGNGREASRMNDCVAMHLQSGQQIALFPEGTTSNGASVFPFHRALFQGAIAVEAPIQPLAIAYFSKDKVRSDAPAYTIEVSLISSLRQIIASPELSVELQQLPSLLPQGQDRRELATQSHAVIHHAVTQMLPQDPTQHSLTISSSLFTSPAHPYSC